MVEGIAIDYHRSYTKHFACGRGRLDVEVVSVRRLRLRLDLLSWVGDWPRRKRLCDEVLESETESEILTHFEREIGSRKNTSGFVCRYDMTQIVRLIVPCRSFSAPENENENETSTLSTMIRCRMSSSKQSPSPSLRRLAQARPAWACFADTLLTPPLAHPCRYL